MATTAYSFDPSGTSSANRIINEQHVLVAQNFRNYHYIIPNFAPFVERNFKATITSPSGVIRTLVPGIDFYFSNKFRDATLACAVPVWGSISFLDTDTFGIVAIEYNTIGGIWTLTPQEISKIMAEELRNPRITAWEQITNPPERFPVVNHKWDLVDWTGAKQLQESIDSVAEAILQSGDGVITEHVNSSANPHAVTKAQVGLGSVQNYAIATQAQAQTGTSSTTYMTPLRTVDTINATVGLALTTHIGDKTNPHNTTKVQVGLGNVENFPTATQQQAEEGVVGIAYMTPLATKQAIDAQSTSALNTHIANKQNPHDTDKVQVGLGNVQNYPIATQDEARAGSSNLAYMSPLRTRQLVLEYVNVELGGHSSRVDNPHQVTATQVGLGLVQNYGIATPEEAQAGATNIKYMTPLRVKQAVAQLTQEAVELHAGRTDNPHSVTKSQVGLSSVQNYGIATQQQAEEGTVTNRYMTPLATKQAIAVQSTSVINIHTADKNNPHGTTAAQVGLGFVQNYDMATVAEAVVGLATDRYINPFGARQLVVSYVSSVVDPHVNSIANPHAVTKAQVGLGSVQNYATATRTEALEGIASNLYMVPVTTKELVLALFNPALNEHATNTGNPHNTTKAQVGLSNVSNFAVATEAEAVVGLSTTTYMTPALVKAAALSNAGDVVKQHVDDKNNPHQTTKAQVSLGSVQNYGIATQAQAALGTVATAYMTPLATKQAIDALVTPAISSHVNNTTNPHQTTAAQVGLSNVQNYPIATSAEAVSATSNVTYVTPLRVKTYVDIVVAPYSTHVANTGNPHNTTKAQVGLGSVQNFNTATDLEAIAGTAVNLYMTPATTKATIASSTTAFTNHVNNTTNPHQTTAAQVGLSNVQNYPVATILESQEGIINNAYMTPQRTKDAITSLVGTAFTNHVNNTGNPHATTATQVGLGLVQNYPIATMSQATAGTVNTVYMTPLRTKEAIGVLAAPLSHVTNFTNPHNTTATQVGAYSKEEADVSYATFVKRSDTWVSGQDRESFIAIVRSGTSANASALDGVTLPTLLKQTARAATALSYDKINTTDPVTDPYRWLQIGTIVSPTDSSLLKAGTITANNPDAYWLLTGGHAQATTPANNAQTSSPAYLIHAKNGGATTNAHAFDITRLTGTANTDVQFGYAVGVDLVFTVWLRVAYGHNSVSVSQLASLGNSLTLNDNIVTLVEPTGIVYATPVGVVTDNTLADVLNRVTALENTINSVTVV